MSIQDHDQDQSRIFRTLEAILLSPVTGRAVAQALMSQATARETRAVIPDLSTHRGGIVRTQDAQASDITGARGSPTSPWARSG